MVFTHHLQYIICYCLYASSAVHKLLLFIRIICSTLVVIVNTHHMQYISCYCLYASCEMHCAVHKLILFISIMCSTVVVVFMNIHKQTKYWYITQKQIIRFTQQTINIFLKKIYVNKKIFLDLQRFGFLSFPISLVNPG